MIPMIDQIQKLEFWSVPILLMHDGHSECQGYYDFDSALFGRVRVRVTHSTMLRGKNLQQSNTEKRRLCTLASIYVNKSDKYVCPVKV